MLGQVTPCFERLCQVRTMQAWLCLVRQG